MKNLISSFALLLTLNLMADLGVSEDFVKRFSSLPSYTNVTLSPDGKMIGVMTRMPDDKKGLTIWDANDLSLINTITLSNDEEIGNYMWANNERLLIQIGYYDKKWGRGSAGEYFSINFDSTKPAYIFGRRSRAGSQKTKGKVVDKFSSGYVENRLKDDDRHVVLTVNEWAKSNTGSFSISVRVNVYNAQQKKLGTSPLAGGQVVTDST